MKVGGHTCPRGKQTQWAHTSYVQHPQSSQPQAAVHQLVYKALTGSNQTAPWLQPARDNSVAQGGLLNTGAHAVIPNNV